VKRGGASNKTLDGIPEGDEWSTSWSSRFISRERAHGTNCYEGMWTPMKGKQASHM